jgi:two-component system response regulator NreC
VNEILDDVDHTPQQESEGAITIVLADDHAVVRSGLKMLLEAEPDISVVAEAADVDSAARYVLGHHPTVLVLDLNMGEESSLPTIPQIRERTPDTAIVVLTMQNDPAFASEALRNGALGYVLKQSAGDELVQAVRLAAAGETYLNPKLGAMLASRPGHADGKLDGLTDRELEVLKLIALGHTNAEIAEQLFLSTRTIETHRSHIQRKTGRSTRAELVRYALDNDLVE